MLRDNRMHSRQHRTDTTSPFFVSPVLDLLGRFVDRARPFWLRAAQLESWLLAKELATVPITRPLFVCGLARSGSTLLHEVLASHPGMATHRIKDYPIVFTPYWWRRALAKAPPSALRERAHHDGMMVHSESPDSVEEMLWMAFFPNCHRIDVPCTFQPPFPRNAFAHFYRNHIRKLLLAENASRYVTKANYHVARLQYLLHLFPDARFILPVRSPHSHIASLLRQQRWFSEGHAANPRALAIMQRTGHFEFGLDRRPMNLGNGELVESIVQLWKNGEEIRGWARYWSMVHGYLASLLQTVPAIQAATRIVPFEQMCESPRETLESLLDHCDLTQKAVILEKFGTRIKMPNYYDRSFREEDAAIIRAETQDVALQWGYDEHGSWSGTLPGFSSSR